MQPSLHNFVVPHPVPRFPYALLLSHDGYHELVVFLTPVILRNSQILAPLPLAFCHYHAGMQTFQWQCGKEKKEDETLLHKKQATTTTAGFFSRYFHFPLPPIALPSLHQSLPKTRSQQVQVVVTMSALSNRLWIRCLDAACASATAPFLVALTRGTLAKSSFKAYIAQDAFYLDSFKQAFASAAHLCRKDADGFGADHFTSLESLIENELKMHAKFALELDIDLAAVRPFPQTLLYTQFLDATAKGQCVSHICAATTPCLKLYGWLGERAFNAGLAHDGNPYARWIREYSSSEFGSSVIRLEMLLDHYATKENPEERDLLLLYAKALELGDFNPPSIHIVINPIPTDYLLSCLSLFNGIRIQFFLGTRNTQLERFEAITVGD